MEEDPLDLVRVAYETWNQHGPAAIAPMLADDVELHDAPQLPDATVWQGRGAVLDRLKAVAEAVGGGSVEFQAFAPHGDAVLVSMLWHLDSETGNAELGEVFHLVETAAGRIARIRVFLTEAEAREA